MYSPEETSAIVSNLLEQWGPDGLLHILFFVTRRKLRDASNLPHAKTEKENLQHLENLLLEGLKRY